MEAAAPGAAPFLPQEVVTVLLAHVGLRERLRACALVCRAWRAAAAAAAATSSISVRWRTKDRILAWLRTNGPQLAALELSGRDHYLWYHRLGRPVLQLAWRALAGLRQLSVKGCDLGSSNLSGPSSLRRLTSLRLEGCALAWPGGLAALAALTALQQLELSGVTVPGSTNKQAAASLGSALCQLRQLTRLELAGEGLAADAALAPSLSRLTQLASLKVAGFAQESAEKRTLRVDWPDLASLQQLSLQSLDLGSSSPSSLCRLTSLRLVWCSLAWPGGLVALSALTGLLQLQLSGVTVPGSTSEQWAASLGSALCQLCQLTRLELASNGLAADAALAPSLSRLARLRELELHDASSLTAASFAASLPAPLTRLVCSSACSLRLSASSSPGLAQLSGLQHLELLRHGGFAPALLCRWPALRHLRLHCDPYLSVGARPGAGASALLAALLALPALDHLELSGSLAGAPAAACSALVAPSALTCLHVSGCQLLACGTSLFSRPLPRLRRLLLPLEMMYADYEGSEDEEDSEDDEQGWEHDGWEHDGWEHDGWEDEEQQQQQQQQQDFGLHALALTASGVARLTACCSQLQELLLPCNAEAGQALAPLTGLARLTGLDVSGPCVDNWAARHVLAALSGLRRLRLSSAPALTWAGLMRLTALQQLESLWVDGTNLFDTGYLELEAQEGGEPVWQQLQRSCRWNPAWRLGIAQEQAADLAAQLSEAQSQAHQLQQAVSAALEHALQLLQQLAQRNGAAQQVQQQLAGQRARADELLQQAAQARGQAGQLLERATQLAAEACEQLLKSDSGARAGQLTVLHAQAAGLEQQAGQLQERGAGAVAPVQLGMVMQLLKQVQRLAEQQAQRLAEQQVQRLAEQQAERVAEQQAQRLAERQLQAAALQQHNRELEAQLAEQHEQIAELRAQLAARRA